MWPVQAEQVVNKSKQRDHYRSPLTMEHLPVEICTLIFSYACMDNGYTGRSLSLVSKYVHEASKSAKFQSLSVVGYEQLEGLADRLEATPLALRNVKYIFISAHPRHTASDPKALAPEYARRELAYAAVKRILAVIGHTVEILHAFFIFYRPFPLLPVSLPVLHELSLHGPLEGPGDVDWWRAIQFPSLRHLHLTPSYSPVFLQKIVRLAPALKDLRICAAEHSMTFASELQAALEGSSASADATNLAASEMFPQNIEKIFVHCPMEPKDNWMDMMFIYVHSMSTLRRLSKEHQRLVLLAPLRFGVFRTVSIQEAEMAWTDSVEGCPKWYQEYAPYI